MIEQFGGKPISVASAEEPFRMVALPQSRTFRCTAAIEALGHKQTHAPQQIASLFDYLVSAEEHQFRHGEVERLRRPQIND